MGTPTARPTTSLSSYRTFNDKSRGRDADTSGTGLPRPRTAKRLVSPSRSRAVAASHLCGVAKFPVSGIQIRNECSKTTPSPTIVLIAL